MLSFQFLKRKWQIIIRSDVNILHSYQQYMSDQISLYLHLVLSHHSYNLYFPRLVMLNTFSSVYRYFYVFYSEIIFSCLLSTFYLDCLYLTGELQEFFMYSRFDYFIIYVLCKYFPPICSLYFHLLNRVFSRTKILIKSKHTHLSFSYGSCPLCQG